MAILTATNLTKTYALGRRQVQALRGIDLTVAQGEYMAVVGPSGSGKSTLLNLLGCLEPPSSGTLLFQGRDVTRMRVKERADLRLRSMGFIFQFFNLFSMLTVYENVEFPLVLSKQRKEKRREKILSVLQRVDLLNHLRHRPGQLSGGQRQRVAVARAGVLQPELVFADEPTANLDSRTGHRILELLRELNQEKNIAFVLATHDLEAVHHAGRVVAIQDGRIVGS